MEWSGKCPLKCRYQMICVVKAIDLEQKVYILTTHVVFFEGTYEIDIFRIEWGYSRREYSMTLYNIYT